MVDSVENITKQARQGSVAAIIQVLNDKLADSGVRTRAIFEDGVLQLLCEAPDVDQLEQSTLVERVRQILESISPRNIRRVKINSRIVREQQLLWLEEINRDPENQLLWSQEITLTRPNLFKQFMEDLQSQQAEQAKAGIPKTPSPRQVREQRQFKRGVVGGTLASLLLLLLGWGAYSWLGPKFQSNSQANTTPSPNTTKSPEPNAVSPSPASSPVSTTSSSTAAIAPSPSPSTSASPSPSPEATAIAPSATPTSADPFADAVRLAEQTASAGKSAQSSADWLALAAKWQQASDLMSQVPAQDKRYSIAQDRTTVYQRHSEAALQEAKKKQGQAASKATNQ
jgi:cytoskeletal protein RodZ